MYFHLIPLQELKRHSVTYWRPGRDMDVSPDTWVVIAERGSGVVATLLDLPATDDTDAPVARDHRTGSALREERAEDALAIFLAGNEFGGRGVREIGRSA